MSSQGPSFAGTASSQGAETAFWSNPSNAEADDGSYTTATLFGSDSSQQLRLTNFGFSIPGGSSIDGLELSIEKSKTGSGNIKDDSLSFRLSGGDVGSGFADSGDWPGSDAVTTYGGSSSAFGYAWVTTDINDSGFGIDIKCKETLGSLAIAQIDYVTIKIYYSSGGGSTGIAKRSIAIIA